MKYVLSMVMVLMAASASFSQTLEDVRKLILNEKFEEAESKLYKMVSEKPDDPVLCFYLGDVHFYSFEINESHKWYQKGIETVPSFPWNYFGLAKIEFENNHIPEANSLLDKGLGFVNQSDWFSLTVAARSCIEAEIKDPQRALQLLEKAAKISPKNSEILILTGDAYFADNNGTQAMVSFRAATAADNKNPLAIARIGELYLKTKSYSESLTNLLTVVKLDSTFAPAYRMFGELYFLSKQYDKTKESYKKYIAYSENNLRSQIRLGAAYYLSKDYKSAAEAYTMVVKSDSTNPKILRLYGYSLYETGDFQRSEYILSKFFSLNDPLKFIFTDYQYYGRALFKVQKDSLAILNLKKALSLDTLKIDLHTDLALAYTHKGDFKSAANEYTILMKKKTPTLNDKFALGRTFYLDKDYVQADSIFTGILVENPALQVGYLWKARSSTGLDPEAKNALAKPHYEKFIETASMDSIKYKRELIESYTYLGFLYYNQNNADSSKINFNKILSLDPANQNANEVLKALKTVKKPKGKK